ncbi:hypothetical protein MJG53_009527 [Ovis ammon polii x Ovis aries]|uniref:Uncharacterized protein n=1 Tax=Ovis ammon polii x Ovis aries TaxID=2918886 RepID=A0ACB9UWM5_9CETA|nr:hypothetical protein MJG53_009527 [Ovis ammon polii x Ovis aries]
MYLFLNKCIIQWTHVARMMHRYSGHETCTEATTTYMFFQGLIFCIKTKKDKNTASNSDKKLDKDLQARQSKLVASSSPPLKMIAISAVSSALLFSLLCEASAVVLLNSTDSSPPTNNFTDIEAALEAQLDSADIPKTRRKRYISQNDMIAILDYHNQVRGKVFPPAANMEYMVWDENLAKSAEAWAATCIWDHGPSYLLRFLGQNLSVRTGRYRSILQLVKPWYDEVKDYAFPYPQDCNPRCPMRCFGPMCTHYTQMVWATSNRIGCAIHTCQNMNVWGALWRRAVYLVCNYAPKGNWIGEAPYKVHARVTFVFTHEVVNAFKQGCGQVNCHSISAVVTDPQIDTLGLIMIPLAVQNCVLHYGEKTREKVACNGQAKRSGRAGVGDFPGEILRAFIMKCTVREWFRVTTVLLMARAIPAMVVPNATLLEKLLEKYMDEDGVWWIAKQRGKRAITDNDMQSILDLHNKLRSQVYPTASNMEYMMLWSCMYSLYTEGSDSYYPPQEEETNEIERQQSQVPDTHIRTVADDSNRNEVISTQQMSQIVSCEVRLRDQCKGTTCNRYECPAGCLDSKAKVIGSVHYEMQSSICRAAIHYGIIDNDGGWVDITRQGRKHYFIKSNRNGVQTVGKYQSANSFTVSKVTVQAVTCETTVEQLCPFHKPASHCPRVYCPRNCMQANPHYARVIGTRIYSDTPLFKKTKSSYKSI